VDTYDVIINGGGLAGSALALALAQNRWTVLLIEQGKLPSLEVSLSHWQSRIYAFAPRPWGWLERLGVELPLARAQAVFKMIVRGDRGGRLEFAAETVPLPYLAMIAEAEAIRFALWQQIEKLSGVTIATGESAQLVAAEWLGESVTVTTADGRRASARLLVGAEGRTSWVREAARLTAEVYPYEHHAVVANFACEKEHRGVAYQWFRDDGVLAYLPLAGKRTSIVWSTQPARAEQLLAASAEDFAAEVAAAGDRVLGHLTLITPPNRFPLSLLRCPKVTARRVLLIGDAAHGIHPLSGHGVNLGFNDAATFSELLGEKTPVKDPGDPLLLIRYARQRFTEPFLLQSVTDALARGFGLAHPLIQRVRNWGMDVVDRLPGLKTHLIRYATLAQW